MEQMDFTPICAENSYLSGYVLSENIVINVFQCLTLCLITENCRSLNVWHNSQEKGNVTCQMNRYQTDQCSDLDTARAANVQYYNINGRYFTSCVDFHRSLSSAVDGEYNLDLGTGKLARVYCHNLTTSNPLVSSALCRHYIKNILSRTEVPLVRLHKT